jgi:hypothetical protein
MKLGWVLRNDAWNSTAPVAEASSCTFSVRTPPPTIGLILLRASNQLLAQISSFIILAYLSQHVLQPSLENHTGAFCILKCD